MPESDFIDVEVTTDAQTLADNAIESLQGRWEGWEPNEGNLEVVVIETISPMAADAAETTARVPSAIFRAYGTDLIGLPYLVGAPARTTLTITLIDDSGGVIPAGSEFEIDGFAFVSDVVRIADIGESSIPAVAVSAADDGTEANGLEGTSVSPLSSLAIIESIIVDDPTAGGVDPEEDVDYQNRLTRDLQLQARTLVTVRDFELMALNHSGVGRVVAQNDGERRVLVTATDLVGAALGGTIKSELVDLYAEFRQVNTVVTIGDATYTTVSVTYGVKSYPGYDAADLESRINDAISAYLNPLDYGKPRLKSEVTLDSTVWLNQPIIYFNKMIDVISDVEGVDYVTDLVMGDQNGRSVTAVASTDVFTLNNHTFVLNQPVEFSDLTGGAGIAAATTYYVRDVTTNSFKVAATIGGAAVNVTSNMTAGIVRPDTDPSGNLPMPGAVPLPTAGILDGTIT